MNIGSMGMNPVQPLNFQPDSIISPKNTYIPEVTGALDSLWEQPEFGVNHATETSFFGSKGDALAVIADRIKDIVMQSLDYSVSAQQDTKAFYKPDGTSQPASSAGTVGAVVDVYA